MRYAIDRIENETAVCEDQESLDFILIPVAELPHGCKEGDIVIEENGLFVIDHILTLERKKRALERLRALKSRNRKK